MGRVRIDEIGGRGLERSQRAHIEDGCADIGRHPVDCMFRQSGRR